MHAHLTSRQIATLLAALRYWQQKLSESELPISDHFDYENTPLTVAEIDRLCEQVNADRLNYVTYARRDPMQSLTIYDTEARGRNGWFRAALVTLYSDEGRINVDIMSKRAVCPAPICLQLSVRDAANLGTTIARLARATMRTARSAVPTPPVRGPHARTIVRPDKAITSSRKVQP